VKNDTAKKDKPQVNLSNFENICVESGLNLGWNSVEIRYKTKVYLSKFQLFNDNTKNLKKDHQKDHANFSASPICPEKNF